MQPQCLCRVLKCIDKFDHFVANHSPGTSLEIITKIYKEASKQSDASRFMVKATDLPQISRYGGYSVELQAYGLHANPKTLEVGHYCHAYQS